MLEHTRGSRRVGMLRWAAVAVLAIAILVPVRVVARTSHSTVEAHSDSDHPGSGNPAGNAYVYFLDDQTVWMNGSVDDDLPRARAARGDTKGELLWFRLGDDAYLIRDAKVLRMVRDLQAVNSKAESGQEDLAREQEAMAAKEQKLAREEDELSTKIDALEQKRDEMQEKRDASTLDAHDAAVLEKLTSEIRQLEGRRAEFERAIEGLSKKQEALDGEQDRTGEEADRNSRILDEKIYRLIEESIPAGFAEHQL